MGKCRLAATVVRKWAIAREMIFFHELDSTFLKLDNKPAYSHLNHQSLFNRHFQYLSAARLAPQESYPKDNYAVEKERQISLEQGKRGKMG